MAKSTKKPAAKKTPSKRSVAPEFRPYRVLFLVIVIVVTTIVLLAALGVSIDQ